MANFSVDLPELQAAIGKVRAQRSLLDGDITALKGHFTKVEAAWSAPSGKVFHDLRTRFEAQATTLSGLLGESADRMQTAYDNYVAAENLNANYFQ